ANMATWRDHLSPYASAAGKPLFDNAFMARWGDVPWSPQEADRRAAGALHTQIASRITTQPLGYLEGDEATALDSVYKLFERTRQIADEVPGGKLFDAIVWHVLNTHVRPFTAKWHPRKLRGALSALDTTDEFRTELAELQPLLSCFDEL